MIRTLVIVAAVSIFPLSASANQIEDSILSQLQGQGFTKIETSRTFLGRTRVTAKSPTLDREIIFNPVTGEILRDYWTERSNGRIGVTLVNPNNTSGSSKAGRTGDDDSDSSSEDSGDDGGDSGGDDGGDSGGDDGGDSGGDDGGDSGGDDGGDSGGDDGGDSGGDDGGDSGGDDGGDSGDD